MCSQAGCHETNQTRSSTYLKDVWKMRNWFKSCSNCKKSATWDWMQTQQVIELDIILLKLWKKMWKTNRNVGVRQHDTPQPRSSPWGSHKIPTTDWGSVHQAKRAIHGSTIASPRWPYWASPSPRPAFQRLCFDSKRRKCSKSHVIHVQGQGLLSFLALRLLSFGWPTSTSRTQRSAGCTRQLLHPAFGTSSDSFPQSSVVRCREQLQQRPSHPEGFAPGSATDPWTRPIHRIHGIHPEFQWFLAQLPRTFGRYGGMELFQSRTKTKVRGGCPPQCTLTVSHQDVQSTALIGLKACFKGY